MPFPTLSIRRTAGIGDAVVATTIAAALTECIMTKVVFRCHRLVAPVVKRCPFVVEVLNSIGPYGALHLDLDGVQPGPAQHLQEAFFAKAHKVLDPIVAGFERVSWERYRPVLVGAVKRNRTNKAPVIAICPRSEYNVRFVPDHIWRDFASYFPRYSCVWLGKSQPPPGLLSVATQPVCAGQFDPKNTNLVSTQEVPGVKAMTIEAVMDILSTADLYVGVDTGPMHIAAALGVPCLVVGQAFDPKLRLPVNVPCRTNQVFYPPLTCLNCQKHQCPINPHIPPCQNIDPKALAQAAMEMLKEG